MSQPPAWLRGPVERIPAELLPAAHAFQQALDDVEQAAGQLGDELLWTRPGDAASPGYHLKHLIGATERLLGYARAEKPTAAQREWLVLETKDGEPATTTAELVSRFREVIAAALEQLGATPVATLGDRRTIGRAELPTTVGGCLFHAAEHAARHAGQLITTVKALQPTIRS